MKKNDGQINNDDTLDKLEDIAIYFEGRDLEEHK